ncbi:transcriptional regulator [Planococcus shenhongbingii]|uniref:Transcriptional regulator n=1 Tax=Planococcus shenhongbingii TaxID=3058398 RepID=A0ABT8NA22_9BACL|nr:MULTISPECIES: transcriptional regulator [unclassified Planococcus (in: firmicutes)]MDN7244734.1 transcriptional regulator [Planococcus sp. N017]WKA57856.1 transcriptional regulator [Planococcus sp. N016]
MLHVKLMKPFYTKKEDHLVRFVFAYQYFSILKDDELFHFIPVEGKEIVVNLNTFQVENLSEVFVFQKGNRFIRLPLYQLLLVSDIHMHLQAILQEEREGLLEVNDQAKQEAEEAIHFLEQENFNRMIDYALAAHDEAMFNDLIKQQQENGGL